MRISGVTAVKYSNKSSSLKRDLNQTPSFKAYYVNYAPGDKLIAITYYANWFMKHLKTLLKLPTDKVNKIIDNEVKMHESILQAFCNKYGFESNNEVIQKLIKDRKQDYHDVLTELRNGKEFLLENEGKEKYLDKVDGLYTSKGDYFNMERLEKIVAEDEEARHAKPPSPSSKPDEWDEIDWLIMD